MPRSQIKTSLESQVKYVSLILKATGATEKSEAVGGTSAFGKVTLALGRLVRKL